MTVKTLEGAKTTLQNIWPPFTSNFNIWTGEQADLWGQKLLVREARMLDYTANPQVDLWISGIIQQY